MGLLNHNTRPLLHVNIITQAFIDIFDIILKCLESMVVIRSANPFSETVTVAVIYLIRQSVME